MEKNIRKNRKNKMTRNNKALVVIDIQNDITKHYRDIIDNINAAIEHSSLVAKARNLRLK